MTKNYPGALDQRGRSYRWRVSVGGKRHVFTLRTTDHKEAERFARERYTELERRADRERDGLPGQVTISALFDQFEREVVPTLAAGTQRSYADSLKPLKRYFVDECGNATVEKIRPGHVMGYLVWRRSRRGDSRRGNVSNRTLAKARAVLHCIFALAKKMEYRDGNPVADADAPKSDGRTPVILSQDEFDGLLESCRDRPMLSLYVLTLGETGARCKSEALWLQWEDIDLKGGFVQIISGRDAHRTKSGKTRWVPMTSRLREAMRDHFAQYRFATYNGQPTPWVFHHVTQSRGQQPGSRIQSLYRGFKAAAKRAKLSPDLVQHDLRHRRVTTWLADDKDVVKVKEAMGHANLATTMGYTHLAKEHLRSLVEEEHREERLTGSA